MVKPSRKLWQVVRYRLTSSCTYSYTEYGILKTWKGSRWSLWYHGSLSFCIYHCYLLLWASLSRFAVFVQEFERRDAAEIAILLASVTSSRFFGEGAVALLSLVRESVKKYLSYLLLILESSFPGRRQEAILPFPHASNFSTSDIRSEGEYLLRCRLFEITWN